MLPFLVLLSFPFPFLLRWTRGLLAENARALLARKMGPARALLARGWDGCLLAELGRFDGRLLSVLGTLGLHRRTSDGQSDCDEQASRK
eukprot:11783_4